MFLEDIGRKCGKILSPTPDSFSFRVWKEEQYEQLAEFVRKHVNVELVMDILFKS